MKPVVDRLAAEYSGKVAFRIMDMGNPNAETKRLMATWGVQYQPTFVFCDSSGAKRDMAVGELSEAQLRAKLNALR